MNHVKLLVRQLAALRRRAGLVVYRLPEVDLRRRRLVLLVRRLLVVGQRGWSLVVDRRAEVGVLDVGHWRRRGRRRWRRCSGRVRVRVGGCVALVRRREIRRRLRRDRARLGIDERLAGPVLEIKCHGAFVLSYHVDLCAIDATSARRRAVRVSQRSIQSARQPTDLFFTQARAPAASEACAGARPARRCAGPPRAARRTPPPPWT